MNVAFLPGFAVAIPRPAAVVFAAQVELSLSAPAFWMTSSILLLVRVFMGKKEREITALSLPILHSLQIQFNNKRFPYLMHIYIFRLIVCFLAVLSINFELRQPHYF